MLKKGNNCLITGWPVQQFNAFERSNNCFERIAKIYESNRKNRFWIKERTAIPQ